MPSAVQHDEIRLVVAQVAARYRCTRWRSRTGPAAWRSARTSARLLRNLANAFSNSLSHGTRLNTSCSAGKRRARPGERRRLRQRPARVDQAAAPAPRTTSLREALANVLTVTYWATLLLMALIIAGCLRVDRPPNALRLQELADLRRQRGELRRQLHVLRDALGVVADDLLGGLRLGDGVVALDQLLQRDDVVALVAEVLRCGVVLLARQDGST